MSSTETITYSTREAALMSGISYRMLDYYLRTDQVRLPDPTPGSGHFRRFTSEEVEQLIAVMEHVRWAHVLLEEFRSGLLWDKKGNPDEQRTRDDAGSRPARGRRTEELA